MLSEDYSLTVVHPSALNSLHGGESTEGSFSLILHSIKPLSSTGLAKGFLGLSPGR